MKPHEDLKLRICQEERTTVKKDRFFALPSQARTARIEPTQAPSLQAAASAIERSPRLTGS